MGVGAGDNVDFVAAVDIGVWVYLSIYTYILSLSLCLYIYAFICFDLWVYMCEFVRMSVCVYWG